MRRGGIMDQACLSFGQELDHSSSISIGEKSMTAKIIDGKAIAATLRKKVGEGVEKLVAEGGQRPGLATVLVGENPASQTYVRMKRKACAELGIESFGHELSADASQEEVESQVREIIVEKFQVAPEKVKADAKLDADLGADSLDLVDLMMMLEDKFSLNISDEEAEKSDDALR